MSCIQRPCFPLMLVCDVRATEDLHWIVLSSRVNHINYSFHPQAKRKCAQQLTRGCSDGCSKELIVITSVRFAPIFNKFNAIFQGCSRETSILSGCSVWFQSKPQYRSIEQGSISCFLFSKRQLQKIRSMSGCLFRGRSIKLLVVIPSIHWT